jgi:hypothetical protein
MMINLSAYRFTRKQVARYTCNDCSVNVIDCGDFCMLQPAIWEEQFGLGWDDNLCLACIEKRLGRRLMMLDFCSFPYVDGYPQSAALLERYGHTAKKMVPA